MFIKAPTQASIELTKLFTHHKEPSVEPCLDLAPKAANNINIAIRGALAIRMAGIFDLPLYELTSHGWVKGSWEMLGRAKQALGTKANVYGVECAFDYYGVK